MQPAFVAAGNEIPEIEICSFPIDCEHAGAEIRTAVCLPISRHLQTASFRQLLDCIGKFQIVHAANPRNDIAASPAAEAVETLGFRKNGTGR